MITVINILTRVFTGGTQRGSKDCFYEICPNNERSEAVLLPIIKKYVRRGTTIITDGWAAYTNLDAHGYVHLDVNHSQNFVDPATGAHTNSIEGSWFHVKKKLGRGGGRRSEDIIAGQLSQFMWRKQRDIASSTKDNDRYFRTELPSLINRSYFKGKARNTAVFGFAV